MNHVADVTCVPTPRASRWDDLDTKSEQRMRFEGPMPRALGERHVGVTESAGCNNTLYDLLTNATAYYTKMRF